MNAIAGCLIHDQRFDKDVCNCFHTKTVLWITIYQIPDTEIQMLS